jgi:hypothetical protein
MHQIESSANLQLAPTENTPYEEETLLNDIALSVQEKEHVWYRSHRILGGLHCHFNVGMGNKVS